VEWSKDWKERAVKQVFSSCQRCGTCCSDVGVVDIYQRDLHRLSRKMHISVEEVVHRFCAIHPKGGSRFTLKKLKPCEFFNGRCRIYQYRPTVCRMTPYLVGEWNYCKQDFGDLPDTNDSAIIISLVKNTGLSATEIIEYLEYVGAVRC